MAQETFDILELRVEGNSVLSTLQIERAVYPFLGPGGSIEKVEKARSQLEKAYHDAGFLTVLVDIPEQEVRGGLVRLKVTEGTVEGLRVRGARYYSGGAIRERLPALAEGGAPYFPQFQDEISRLNRGADRRVTPVLKPGAAPGTVRIELNVQDKLPLHGNVELNDRYSASTTNLRLSGMLRYDNLWQRDHSLTLNAQTAPLDTGEVRVFSASYLMPAGRERLLALYAVETQSDVAAIGTLGVVGQGRIFGARHIIPLRPRGSYYHTLSLGMDYKDFDETVVLLGADSFSTPISYAPFSALYSGTLQDKGGVTQLNLGLNFALREWLGTREEEFANKRFKAHASYAYLRADAQRTHALGKGWSLAGALNTQIANEPLISAEQFAAGGYDSVRGYLEASALGDYGVRGSLELRAPSFPTPPRWGIQQLAPVGFIEGAAVRIHDPLPAQEKSFTLSSAGLGLRLRVAPAFTAALDLAYPFKPSTETEAREPVLKFRLLTEL